LTPIALKRFAAALAAIAGLAICAPAFAHAFLDHASPRVGSTVARSPERITVWLTEELEPAFSTLRVVDAQGKRVDRNDKRIDPADQTAMHVSVPDLPPGTYRVIWRALSADSHVTEGDFTFEVRPR
jgi:copper resistance protein C